jgi:beta-lactamase regulating signal transducer with metallopeptidase domain
MAGCHGCDSSIVAAMLGRSMLATNSRRKHGTQPWNGNGRRAIGAGERRRICGAAQPGLFPPSLDGRGRGEGERTWWRAVLAWTTVVWLAGLLVCLAPLVLRRLSLWRLARRSRRVTSGPLFEMVRRLWHGHLARDKWHGHPAHAARAGRPCHVPRLLLCDREPMPLVWGVLRPTLLLPAEAADWPDGRLRVVLLHELAHARRRDCLTKLIAHLACAAHWFNPLAWLAFVGMQRDAEAACDDLVLAAGHRPSDYATHLLEIASGLNSGMLAAYSSIAMARKSRLEGRLLAILDPRRSRQKLSLLLVLCAVIVGCSVTVPLSTMRARDGEPIATPAQPATQQDEWGAAVEGIQARLTPDKAEWAPDEAPRFVGWVRNTGSKTWGFWLTRQDLVVDGQVYTNMVAGENWMWLVRSGESYQDICI